MGVLNTGKNILNNAANNTKLKDKVSHEYIYANTPKNAKFWLILGSSIASILKVLVNR